MKFKYILFNRIFYWLVWLTIQRLQTSIIQKWLSLISLLFDVLCPEMCLLTNCSNSNASIMVLTVLKFVLLCAPFLSPLLCRWWFVVCALRLQCETWINAVLGGALLTVFIAYRTRTISIHHDQARLPLLINNWGMLWWSNILYFL